MATATRIIDLAQRNIQEPLAARRWHKPSALPPIVAGPGRPVLPVELVHTPRVFDYPTGVNMVSVPRSGFGVAPFSVLRNLAAVSKEVRLNIELIKRTLRALEWKIIPRHMEDKGRWAKEIEQTTAFFEAPDGLHDFDQWLGLILEDVLAVDALTLWPNLDRHGHLTAMEGIDGTTIKPLLDYRGRIAPPPLPAYVQYIKGLPRSWYTRARLIYKPFNVATYTPYGSSPIEYIMLIVNMSLQRDSFHISKFTQGNVPEALVGMPQSWTQPQIDQWQEYWDALLAGNLGQMRRMHFVPHEGSGGLPVFEFRQDDTSNTARDEWLLRVACWAYGNNPAEFGLIPGSGFGGKGFTKGMENVQYRSMLGPMTQYLRSLFNLIIGRWLIHPYLVFKWVGLDPQDDRMQQAQIDEIYLRTGAYNLEFVQDQLGVPDNMRPDGPPAAFGGGGLPFGLAAGNGNGTRINTDSHRHLVKASTEEGLGDDDPFLEDKDELAEQLRAAWMEYVSSLRRRIMRGVQRPEDAP